VGQIVVITNPHARQNAKDPGRPERFERQLGARGVVCETQHLEHLDETCRGLLDRDIDVIGICGGDGTNHLVLTALVKAFAAAGRALPPISFLKGGSMNTIRGNLGLRGSAEKTLAALIEKKETGEAFQLKRQSILQVNGEKCGFFYGNGYVANWLYEYYSENGVSGPQRAAETAYNAIASVISRGAMAQRLGRRFQADVTVDGTPVAIREFGMIMAGFIVDVGIGFKALYRAHEKEGSFHVVATALRPGQIAAQVHRFYMGRRLQGEGHFDELARELVIRSEEPLGYTLDGEMYKTTEFRVATGPTIDIVMS
jgi:diacylglycerol kinase family enzyme